MGVGNRSPRALRSDRRFRSFDTVDSSSLPHKYLSFFNGSDFEVGIRTMGYATEAAGGAEAEPVAAAA